MNNELFVLIKRHTDAITEQTKTKPQETLEYKLNKQLETFAFNPPIILVEERKWMIAITSFEATNSDLSIIDENNSFLISIPRQWRILNHLKGGTFYKL